MARDLTIAERAYIAGIIDGEGCICFGKRKGWHELRVVVKHTNPILIAWLLDRLGGSICLHKARSDKHKDSHIWTITTKQAASMLALILPYLLIKQNQALVGLKLQALKEGRGKGPKEDSDDAQIVEDLIAEDMHKLNQKGPTDA